MKYVIPVISFCLFFLACQDTSKKQARSIDTTAAIAKDSTYLKRDFEYIQLVPDSLRTPEQKVLVRKLLKISVNNIKVVDNQMIFDMSKGEFSQTGIPIEYYELFKKNMRDNNEYIKSHNIQNVDKMMEEYRRNAREYLNQ